MSTIYRLIIFNQKYLLKNNVSFMLKKMQLKIKYIDHKYNIGLIFPKFPGYSRWQGQHYIAIGQTGPAGSVNHIAKYL